MKILSGVDIVNMKRFGNNVRPKDDGTLPHFVTRCYTENEIRYCLAKGNEKSKIESFAGRFAAKEAVSKALGTGIMTMGIGFVDIEIDVDQNGAPFVILHNEAKKRAEQLNVISQSISLSHDGEYAVAYCNMLACEEGDRN